MNARSRYLLVAAILLFGVLLRCIAFSPYAIHHPDEAIQYIEQAHRLVFGTGVVPWEYRLGMRSWIMPLLLAGPMWLGGAIAPGSILYVVLPRAAAALFAFATMPAAYVIARRVSRAHAMVALAVFALWYESIYFSVHVLTESLAVAAFFLAAALLGPGVSRWRLALGGALLMLTVVFRIHYSPAAGVFALVLFRARWRDWKWLVAGALPIALVSGGIDIMMGQRPYGWVYQNFYQNIVAGKAAEFGSFGPEAYPQMLWLHWQVALVPILWLAARAARRFPALTAAALVNMAVHLAIGHKEYRFILLSGQIAILLAAIGSVDLIDREKARWSTRAPSRSVLLSMLVALWGASSLLLAFSTLGNPGWRGFESGFRLARAASERRVCGVTLLGGSYWSVGGQTYLGAIPLYYARAQDGATENRRIARTGYAYNAIIAAESRPLPASYRRVRCEGDVPVRLCLAIRAGTCRRDARSDTLLMQRVIEAEGR